MSEPLMATYNRLPVTFDRGEGVWLWDTNGRRYLDALSGIAVCGLGHAHPAVREALCEQAARLIHTSNLYGVAEQERFGALLTAQAGMDRVFFANSGAEANEAAIKLARLHAHRRGIEAPAILVAEHSFHGRTLATLSATGNRKVQAGFEPLVQGFVRVPYDDLDAIETAAANRPNIVAILIEPIQGEGGIRVPSDDYLIRLRELCDRSGWLLMLDEVQTGIGRTGRLFAFQHAGIQPDVMTLAKGLGNGVPIGACLARGAAAEVFTPGSHGSTFGGNPLVCRVGRAVLETLIEGNLIANAEVQGAYLLDSLRAALAKTRGVVEIRGRGLMVGIELDRPCGALVGRALDAGLLINVTAERVIRLLPPLIIDRAQVEELVATLTGLIHGFLGDA
ncbi:aspartate aminotransferase family protein [Thermochromatium tepidum]|uniref:Acetylornithine aminotransferase n=1 Tax=Thermochromatium tepidum ATCC 43061 TaxID=316276 RepID=A0A6I6DXY8_THETI|nr:aspartate aminotransferase family protein [Thermochromatium tepidum]QGU32451.1 acetylornithine/succinylornithine family transaminase [Thermochromatium tepidum ATCC 43061]